MTGVGVTLFLVCLIMTSNSLIHTASAAEKPLVSISQSAQEIWQRQQVFITLIVRTNDSFARLEVDDFKQQGFSIIPSEFKRIVTKKETQLILKWGIYPYVAGKQKLKLPTIVFRPNRGRKQILEVKELSVNVRQLPLYVSPTMPVGNISIENQWDNGSIVYTNDLIEWNVKVTGENVAPETMPPLSRNIASSTELQILPIQHEKETMFTEQGILQQERYNIPLKILKSGIFNFPQLSQQYFEPNSGKLKKSTLTQPFVISLNKWIYIALMILALALYVKLMFIISDFAKARISLMLKRRQAVKLFTQAQNYLQLRSAVNQLSMVEGWGANLSFNSFLDKWEKSFGRSMTLKNKINHLQDEYFSVGNS